MAIRIFRQTDTSAPILNSVAGTMIGVLDACLVNGYGDQSSLGQTKPLSGTNLAVYKQPAGTSGMHLAVDDTNGQTVYFRGFETITSPQASGMNLITLSPPIGTNPFPTYSQLTGPSQAKSSLAAGNATARPQLMISNGKIFYFYCDLNADGGYSGRIFCFGDINTYHPDDTNHCIIITHSYNYFCQFSLPNGSTVPEHYLSRKQDGFSSSSACGKIPYLTYHPQYVFGFEGVVFPITPDPILGGFSLTPIQITEPASGSTIILRGLLPGIQAPCTGVGFQNGDTYQGTLGDLAGRTFEVVRSNSYYGANQRNSFVFFETSDTWDTKLFR